MCMRQEKDMGTAACSAKAGASLIPTCGAEPGSGLKSVAPAS